MNRLNVALGPQGANKHGAFSRLINVSAANLAGNGKAFNSMLQNFSDFIATLGANRNNFFQTVVNLQQFTTTMARDDGGVRRLAGDLATVSSFLDGERSDLAAAMHNLSISLGLVAQFVHHNAAALTGDIHGIASVTTGLLREKRALIEVLDQAPLALQNLAETFYPGQHHDLRTKGNQVNGNSGPCAPGGLLYAVLTSLGYACPSSSSAVPGLPSHSSAGSRRSGLGQVLGAGL
jgi:phospholipid/cholesterol/gamma-HCH transport system substrate-binding protein